MVAFLLHTHFSHQHTTKHTIWYLVHERGRRDLTDGDKSYSWRLISCLITEAEAWVSITVLHQYGKRPSLLATLHLSGTSSSPQLLMEHDVVTSAIDGSTAF